MDTLNNELLLTETAFYNSDGYLRRKLVNNYFGLITKVVGSYLKKGVEHDVKARIQIKPLNPSDLSTITDLYTTWRDFEESAPIKFVYKDHRVLGCSGDFNYLKKGKPTTEPMVNRVVDFYSRHFNVVCQEYKGFVYVPTEVYEWSAVPCCKRGNPEYIRRVKEKLEPFVTQEPLIFFDTNITTKRKRQRKTNMLYISGTTDPSICGFDLGWLAFGSHWNSFITNIRQQFKCKIVYIRTWQSHENGYPHFHALIYFEGIEFTAVPWFNEKNQLSWRIPSRSKLHKGDDLTIRQRFKTAWKYGNIDIVCVSDTQQAFKDMLKYVTRDLEGGESDLTNAMIWFFGKQAFSYSKDFTRIVWGTNNDIDLTVGQNNDDLIGTNRSNSNLELIRVEIFPYISTDLVYKSYADQPKTYQKYLFGAEHPPPKHEIAMINVDFIENSVLDYVMIECKKSEKFDCPVYRYKKR